MRNVWKTGLYLCFGGIFPSNAANETPWDSAGMPVRLCVWSAAFDVEYSSLDRSMKSIVKSRDRLVPVTFVVVSFRSYSLYAMYIHDELALYESMHGRVRAERTHLPILSNSKRRA